MTADLLWRAYQASAHRWDSLNARVAARACWFVAMHRKKIDQPRDLDDLEAAVIASEKELARSSRLAKAAAAREPKTASPARVRP